MESIQLIEYRHIEGRGNRALFFITADMQILVISTPICQAMNQSGVSVEGKDNRLIPGKKRIEILIA